MNTSFDELVENNDAEAFALHLLDAFEDYHKNDAINGIKELFGDYFCEYDRIDDFMTQLKFKFFKKLDLDKQLFFSYGYSSAFSKYDIKQHEKGTLYFLLDFMLYSDTYNIFPSLKNIWRELENIGFENYKNRSFALEVLRYVSAATDTEKAYGFMKRVHNSKKFHLDFAVQVLLVVANHKLRELPILVDKYTKLGWKSHEDDNFFAMMSEYIVDEIGLSDIIGTLDDFEYETLWFVEKLLSSVDITYDYEDKVDNPGFILRNDFEEVRMQNLSMNLETILREQIPSNSHHGKPGFICDPSPNPYKGTREERSPK